MSNRIFFNNNLIAGPSSLDRLGEVVAETGKKALLVTGRGSLRRSGALDRIGDLLASAGIGFALFEGVDANPDVECVERCAEAGRSGGADFLVAVGGGSVLDTAKAAAAMLTNPGPLADYLETAGASRPLTAAPASVIAVPTTAGTGSEATQNAVVSLSLRKVKTSLRSPILVPRCAILDPSLVATAPDGIVTAAGMDALTQLVEPLTGRRAHPFTDGLCLDGIRRINRSLVKFVKDRGDLQAGLDLQLAAYQSGLALASAGLGAVHAMARPLGGIFNLPHGLVCSVLLPEITRLNWKSNVPKYAAAGHSLGAGETWSDGKAAAFCADRIAELARELGVPPDLKSFGLGRENIARIVAECGGSSLDNNPAILDPSALTALLERIL